MLWPETQIRVMKMLLPSPEADTEASLFIPKIFLNSDVLNMKANRILGTWFIVKHFHISWAFRSQTICCIIHVFSLGSVPIFIQTFRKSHWTSSLWRRGSGLFLLLFSLVLQFSPVSCLLPDTCSTFSSFQT